MKHGRCIKKPIITTKAQKLLLLGIKSWTPCTSELFAWNCDAIPSSLLSPSRWERPRLLCPTPHVKRPALRPVKGAEILPAPVVGDRRKNGWFQSALDWWSPSHPSKFSHALLGASANHAAPWPAWFEQNSVSDGCLRVLATGICGFQSSKNRGVFCGDGSYLVLDWPAFFNGNDESSPRLGCWLQAPRP